MATRRVLSGVLLLALASWAAAAVGAGGQPVRFFQKLGYYEREGEKVKEREAQLVVDPQRRVLVFAAEGDIDRQFRVVPWDQITKLTYAHSEHVRVKTTILAPWSFWLKGKKHWLTIDLGSGDPSQPGESMTVRLDKDNYQAILQTLCSLTGIDVQEVGEKGDVHALYRSSPVSPPSTAPRTGVGASLPGPSAPTQDAERYEIVAVALDGIQVGQTPSGAVAEFLARTHAQPSDWQDRKGRRTMFVLLTVEAIHGVHVYPLVDGWTTRLHDQRGKKHAHGFHAILPIRATDGDGAATEGFQVSSRELRLGFDPLSGSSRRTGGFVGQTIERTESGWLTCWVMGPANCFEPEAVPKGDFTLWLAPEAKILLVFGLPEGAEPQRLTFGYHYFTGWDGRTFTKKLETFRAKIEIDLSDGASP